MVRGPLEKLRLLHTCLAAMDVLVMDAMVMDATWRLIRFWGILFNYSRYAVSKIRTVE